MAYIDEINERVQKVVTKHLIDTIADKEGRRYFEKNEFYEAVYAVKNLGILSEGCADILRVNIMDLYENACDYSRIFSTIGKLLSYEEISSIIGNELVRINIPAMMSSIINYKYRRDNGLIRDN